jgi:hypothetical protein
VTPYLFMYLRAAQHPVINEAAPATFDALLAVIRRAQYPPRTPLDDPTVAARPRQSRPYPVPARVAAAQLLPVLRLAVGAVARRRDRTVVTVLFVGLGLRGFAPVAERPGRRLAPARALPGDRARAGRLHELPAGLQSRLPPLAQARRPRGAGAGLLLRGELHRLGLWAGIGAAGLAGRLRGPALRRWQPAVLLLAWCRSASTGPPPAGGTGPTRGLPRTSPTTCSTACRHTACCSPTATTTPFRSGGPRRSRASART